MEKARKVLDLCDLAPWGAPLLRAQERYTGGQKNKYSAIVRAYLQEGSQESGGEGRREAPERLRKRLS